MNRIVTAGVVALALAAPATAQDDTRSGSRAATPTGVVEVENAAGAVRIVGWELGEVRYNATLGRGAEDLLVAGGPGRLIFKVVVPRTARNIRGSDLLLHVPAGSRVEVNTVGAHVEIAKLTGTANVETVSGTVTIDGAVREAEVQTVSGFVKATGLAGPAGVRTVSGDIELEGVRGRLAATTVSGDISARGGLTARSTVQTTSGRIRFEGDVASGASIEAKTVSGAVELTLPAAVAADFELSSFSGDISSDFGPRPAQRSEPGPGVESSFTTGQGGARIRVRTFSGDITLRKR